MASTYVFSKCQIVSTRMWKILGANHPLGAIVKTLSKTVLRGFQKL